MKTGIELIAQERNEQIVKHEHTLDTDSILNTNKQLSNGARLLIYPDSTASECPDGWDEDRWYKMRCKPYKERLIIAGALIAAELDRINQ